jgi:hypothetical protein
MPVTPIWGLPYADENEFATDYPVQIDAPRAALLDGYLNQIAAYLAYLGVRDTNMVQSDAAGVKIARGFLELAALAAGATATVTAYWPPGLFTSPPAVVGTAANSRVTVAVQNTDAVGVTFAASNWTPAAVPGATGIWWIAVGGGAPAVAESRPTLPEPGSQLPETDPA